MEKDSQAQAVRILYLAPDAVPSPKGAGVRIRLTVETLAALGHDVALFTPRSPAGPLSANHHSVELDHHNFLDRMLAFRRAAGAWLDEQHGDVVMFRSIWEGAAAAAWAHRNGNRAVYEAHGFPSIELSHHYPAVGESDVLDKILGEENMLLRAVDRIVTPSRTGRRYLQMRGVAAERIAVVPNAVCGELFTPPSEPPDDAPPFRLVYQGTLAPWQGLGTLLEALVRFRAGGRVELHVVGPMKGVWRRSLRALARRLRVHHVVRLSAAMDRRDLATVLRTAHVCVAPLTADPRNALMGCCPLKVLEYMAAGRPILATRVAPVEEILDDRENALLVRPSSPAALADGIAWMLAHRDEREELGRKARDHALASWTPAQFATRLASALQPIVDALPQPAREA